MATRPRQSKTQRAGLIMSVGRIESRLRKARVVERVSPTSAVYLAAVLEYLSAELLELSGNAAQQNRKHRIVPRHIMMAIANDSELNELLKGVQISGSGVLPYIHPAMLPKNSKKKAVMVADSMDVTASQEI